MKGKFITKQILLACKSKPSSIKKDIHAELQETIAERKRIIQQWESVLQSKPPVIKSIHKDIHAQLAETIAGHIKIMEQWRALFTTDKDNVFVMQDKKAA